ncbi:MAG TPA: dihydrofolate reductase family protein [Patescibacteria group bacterium]|nr:dihydrofolate reductase family protein [Patescibacteria group bacterium]
MRKLKLQVQMTIDGFIGGPNGEMDWLTFPWTEDINAYVSGIVSNIGTIVLGRKLAEGFIPHWAGVAADPENPEYEGGRVFSDTPKVVFTKTLETSPWENTVLAKGNLVEEITALKNEEGRDIYACGGATFVSSLIAADLVDEYYLFVNPTAIGNGMPIFKNVEDKLRLKLVKATTFDCGIIALNFERAQQ